MRLWSIHPSYLDSKGLVALWREGLLARKVLEGKTKGYKNHPQLLRFKAAKDPMKAIDAYLKAVAEEAKERGYNFDTSKILSVRTSPILTVTDGQMAHEMLHLSGKLTVRDPERLKSLSRKGSVKAHPLFQIIPGEVEDWEKITDTSKATSGASARI
jgi:hypothetical protein